jgi:hypothetical protein
VSLSSIGPFTFVRISELPQAPAQTIQLESRAGVNGIGAWATGVRGRETTIETVADTVNFADAVLAVTNYRLLIGEAAQSLVYGGIAMAYGLLILDVTPVETTQTCLGIGGRLGQSRGLCVARWRVIPTY